MTTPAAAQDDMWPTVEELRRDLQNFGWEWYASGLTWVGKASPDAIVVGLRRRTARHDDLDSTRADRADVTIAPSGLVA